MTEEAQMQGQAQVPQIQLGFAIALTKMYGQNWRETATENQVNTARHFYHSGLDDMQTLVQINNAQLSQNVHSIFSTLTVGAEKQIADQQALTSSTLRALSTTQLAALSTTQLDALHTSQVGALTAKAIKALSPKVVKGKAAKAPVKAAKSTASKSVGNSSKGKK